MLPLLYQDRHIEIVDKPVGLAVIPGRNGGESIAGLTGRLIVHRLDTETSGCLVLARSVAGQRMISIAFEERRVKKEYAVVVVGELPDAGTINLPIGRWHNGRVSTGSGKDAVTGYRVVWRRDGRCGVIAEPVTGRTHQIRAHLASLRAPILGDVMYGAPAAERIFLHAHRITLPWPKREDALTVEAPMPDGFG